MVVANIEDLRTRARRRLPRLFFDYIDGGSFGEQTAAANTGDFDDWLLEQRVLASLTDRDLSATYLGEQRRLPFLLGPLGFTGLFAPQGEILAARAAHAAGIPFCLSNFGVATLEELRRASDGPLWFQLYLIKHRELVETFIGRAERVGVDALCVTVDCAVGGVRERDLRSGFRSLSRMTPRLALSLLSRPRWCLSVARRGMPGIGHLAGRPEFGKGVLQQAVSLGRLIDPNVGWDDLSRIRDRWKGKLIVKGILHADDAVRVADLGADGLVVSNHGGRELDGAPSTIAVLPEIVAAVGHRLDVLLDGGVRRGSHVVKALALGAKAVLLGRAYAYGLAAAGQQGVSQAIDMLATEIDVTIAQMGVLRAADLHARRGQVLRRRSPVGVRPSVGPG